MIAALQYFKIDTYVLVAMGFLGVTQWVGYNYGIGSPSETVAYSVAGIWWGLCFIRILIGDKISKKDMNDIWEGE